MLCAGPISLIGRIALVLNGMILGDTAHVSHTVMLYLSLAILEFYLIHIFFIFSIVLPILIAVFFLGENSVV